MTTELRLRIDKYLEGDFERPPEIFAKIYPAGKSEGKPRITGAPREELIPISHLEKDTKSIPLKPGRYIVEAVLPSGEMFSGDISLKGNEKKDLIFRAQYSPHEWLSWQHLMGNVSTTPAIKPRAKRRVSPRSPTKRKGMFASKGAEGGGSLVRPSEIQPRVPEIKPELPLQFLNTPDAFLAEQTKQYKVWSWLAQLSASTPAALIRKLNANEGPISVNPYAYDNNDKNSVFRISLHKPSSAVTPLGFPDLQRHFMALRRRKSIELLSLPMPWGVKDKPIEIAVHEPADESSFCSSMSVLDNDFGMLLGYLSSGSVPTARRFAETAEMMLFEKLENPYAAAAGAYALVGTALQASPQNWHQWVKNLMNWFETIPDGAIQWGQLNLRMRRNANDMKEARQAFKLAFKRGLPFYSLGMRWLVDGLEAISRDDSEAAEMLTHVRPVSWITNYQQPFTVLKLDTHRHV